MDASGDVQTPTRRMLVVDDRENMRNLLETAFSEHGFDVVTATCGEEAIELISNQPFDIVVTDLSMPGKNGIEVLKAAKAAAPDTEVIIVTAYGTIETAVEAMRLGAYDFITKPFKLSEIERKVDKIVRKIQPPRAQPIQTWIHPSVQHFVGSSAQTRHS